MESKRLNKFISDAGFCSRREADTLIEEGRVTVNGKLPDPGLKVTAKDKVRIDDQLLRVREEETVFLLFNKPAGMSATADMGVRDNVIRAINFPASLQPIGHLDREAEGILFLSNDAELVRKISRADNRYEKEYLVTVDKLINQEFLNKLGSSPDDKPETKTVRPFAVKETSTRFRIILKPDTNHNLKQLCQNLGYKVVHLQRVRIDNFKLTKLPVGHWRVLNVAEIQSLTSVANKGGKSIAATADFSFPKGGGAGKRIGKSRPAGTPGAPKRSGASGGRSSAPAKAGGRKPGAPKSQSPRTSDGKRSTGSAGKKGR